jgi:predicted nucleic acid-binding protein
MSGCAAPAGERSSRHRRRSFGPEEAALAARLYSEVPRPRGREVDLAIAASALTHDADLWTLNRVDFRDIPQLVLYEPTS